MWQIRYKNILYWILLMNSILHKILSRRRLCSNLLFIFPLINLVAKVVFSKMYLVLKKEKKGIRHTLTPTNRKANFMNKPETFHDPRWVLWLVLERRQQKVAPYALAPSWMLFPQNNALVTSCYSHYSVYSQIGYASCLKNNKLNLCM